MDTALCEQAVRREAIRRRLSGESRHTICADLNRSTSWFDKWWAAYRQHPRSDLADRSRAPQHSPRQTSPTVVKAVITVRQQLEAATTPDMRYGLIGAAAIQTHLEALALPPPSTRTIQRILQTHELTHPIGAGAAAAYYPWPAAWDVNAIHATDIITKYIRGGDTIENFHTIDHYSHAVALNQYETKDAALSCAHLRASWRVLGLPQLQQLDNENTFRGGHTHPRVFGQVVRLCLFCGIEPLFTPVYEAKRNYQIESFHSLWNSAFWSRHEFRSCAEVRAESPLFAHWYHSRYRPPSLHEHTPAQMRQGAAIMRLTRELQGLIPEGRLPLTAGRIHFMRKVQATGAVSVLNESWLVGNKWSGEYVRVTINTTKQVLTIWHKPDADRDWRPLKTRLLPLPESVQPLLPAFRRNRTRCLGYWPD